MAFEILLKIDIKLCNLIINHNLLDFDKLILCQVNNGKFHGLSLLGWLNKIFLLKTFIIHETIFPHFFVWNKMAYFFSKNKVPAVWTDTWNCSVSFCKTAEVKAVSEDSSFRVCIEFALRQIHCNNCFLIVNQVIRLHAELGLEVWRELLVKRSIEILWIWFVSV